MLDFSFDNSSWSSDGLCRIFPTSQARSLYFQTDSAFGDPLTWSGTNSPPPRVANRAPVIRLSLGEAVAITPSLSGHFVDGVWSGLVTVLWPVSNLFLRVVDADDHVGLGNDFAVESATDTDGDGLPDAWEMRYFGALNSPSGGPDDDPDHDGITNLDELWAGANPIGPLATSSLSSVRLEGRDVRISFATVAGGSYRVEQTDNLSSGLWTWVADGIAGTGSIVQVLDPGGASQPCRFYRVTAVFKELPPRIEKTVPLIRPPARRSSP